MILGGTYWILGNYHEGRRHYEITLAMIRADALDSTSAPLLLWQAAANSRAWMVFILVELGEFDRALQIAQDATRQVEAREIFHPLPRFARPYRMSSAGRRVPFQTWNAGSACAEK